jgi:hypothetical protein
VESINQKSQSAEQPDPLSQAYYLVPASQKIASTKKPKPQENSNGLTTKTLLTAAAILTTLGTTYFTYNNNVLSPPPPTSYPVRAIPFIVVLAGIAFLASSKPPIPKTLENHPSILPPQMQRSDHPTEIKKDDPTSPTKIEPAEDSSEMSNEEPILPTEKDPVCAEFTKMLEDLKEDEALSVYKKINDHLLSLERSLNEPQKELMLSYTDSLLKKLDRLTPKDFLSGSLSLLLKKVFEKMLVIDKNAPLKIAKKCVLRLNFHSIYREIIDTILSETNLGIPLTIDCVIKQEKCEDEIERQKYQPAINIFLDFFINNTSKLAKFLEACSQLDPVKYASFQKSIIAKLYESEKKCVSVNTFTDYINSIDDMDKFVEFSPSNFLSLKNATYLNDNLILALRIFLHFKNYNMFLELLNQCKLLFPDQYHELYRQAHHRMKELPEARALLGKLERPPTFQENEDESSDFKSPQRGPYFGRRSDGSIVTNQSLTFY